MIPYERRKQMLQQLEESELVTLEDFWRSSSGSFPVHCEKRFENAGR